MVIIVAENKAQYTRRAVEQAQLARDIQCMIGQPSTAQFTKIIQNNLLPNCPVSVDDLQAVEHIFGPNLGSLKGKTVRRGGVPVNMVPVSIPEPLLLRYRDVTIAWDVMYGNKVPFVLTVSRHLKFCMAQVLKDQKSETIVDAIKAIKVTYACREFTIHNILLDGQFEPLRLPLADLGINANISARGEHVPEAERQIRTIQDRC